jgi:23S rRNA (cytidine2498-2'-O)-methyltransferase
MIALACCRAGFEGEALQDIERVATAAAARASGTPSPGAGYVACTLDGLDLARWRAALAAAPPVFCRSLFVGSGPHVIAPAGQSTQHARFDRVSPLVEAIAALDVRGQALWLEYPDTNEGKALSQLARAIEPRLAVALRERGVLDAAQDRAGAPRIAPRNQRRLHVFLASGREAFVGTSVAETGARWPMGIPRLRMPGKAPSRSTLKLAEAFAVFLGENEHELVRAGMRAVDLGAAPGGWSWQLAQRGLRVTAVDNGPLKGEVADDALVAHVRVDGFRFVPPRPVDWVVCDMVEQPSRVAALMARWIGERRARNAIFNLKLPMKRRHAEIERAGTIIEEALAPTGVDATLAMRHLYHDREEVSAFLARTR